MNKPGTKHSFMLLLGTLFGAGYLPKAPGTWGSLLFLPFIYVSFQFLGYTGLILLTLIASALSILTAPAAISHIGPDPGEFVMDECAGEALVFTIALPLFHTTPDIQNLILGFILFRIFDIAKPLGIKRVENFHGKYGILADDLLAGIYASLSLMAIYYIISLF